MIEVINLWKSFYLKKGSSFWIYHKNGNMGRPYDAQNTLEDISIKDDLVEITYDKYRKVLIQGPAKIELSKDKVGNIRLVFLGFDFVEIFEHAREKNSTVSSLAVSLTPRCQTLRYH